MGMALTLEQIDARIDAIDLAIGRGERTIQFSDRSTTFDSVEAMLKRRAHFVQLRTALAGGRAKQTLVYGQKGFCS